MSKIPDISETHALIQVSVSDKNSVSYTWYGRDFKGAIILEALRKTLKTPTVPRSTQVF